MFEFYFYFKNLFYYVKFSSIPSGSKLIKRYPANDDIIFIHTCDIIFDQSACSIFVCCQALVVFSSFVIL